MNHPVVLYSVRFIDLDKFLFIFNPHLIIKELIVKNPSSTFEFRWN